MTPKKTDSSSGGGIERRRTKRRPILDTFSVFVVVPKKGMHRLQVHDVSEHGIGFELDTEGEESSDFPVKLGDRLEVYFYLNQSLFLPLSVQIARLETPQGVRRVGASLTEKDSKGHQAFLSFIQMLDSIAEVAQIQSR